MQSFSAGACTWPKILLRLQVWNLFAIGEQIMRVADCKFCQKRALPFFDSFVQPAGLSMMMIPFAMGRSLYKSARTAPNGAYKRFAQQNLAAGGIYFRRRK